MVGMKRMGWEFQRCIRALRSASSLATSSNAVFDSSVKAAHRERAAFVARARRKKNELTMDPFQKEVATRLVERLAEVKRRFSRVLLIGGASHAVLGQLCDVLSPSDLEHVVVLDTERAMLDLCRDASRRLSLARPLVTRHIDDMESRHHESFVAQGEDRFQLVVACLGLHWHNDLVSVLRKCQRSLEPDGFFLGSLLGEETMHEMRVSCMIAEAERESGFEAQRISPMALVRDAGALLSSAGFALPSVDVDSITMRYRTPFDAVRHVRAMAESAAPVGGTRRVRFESALAAQAIYQHTFGNDGSDGVPATYQVINLAGWSPHMSQAAPARRGSATASLADIEQFLPPPVFTEIHEQDDSTLPTDSDDSTATDTTSAPDDERQQSTNHTSHPNSDSDDDDFHPQR